MNYDNPNEKIDYSGIAAEIDARVILDQAEHTKPFTDPERDLARIDKATTELMKAVITKIG